MSSEWIRLELAKYSELTELEPHGVCVQGRDLILIRHGDQVAVLSGRCPHRGARLAEAKIDGDLLVCGSHGWDFHYRDGTSPSNPEDNLRQFSARIDLDADVVWIDEADFERWAETYQEVFDPDELMI
ncbi:MAG: Rieske (2Fe-2S) protein [Deltaproteobacteria bacterium]|nr:Rieske (2Fe-2S) protein [Deltaproteobacteria bacterium]